MKKLSDFQTAQINIGSIWGGGPGNCYTLKTETGTTTNPCGETDDQHYMVLDDSGTGSFS